MPLLSINSIKMHQHTMLIYTQAYFMVYRQPNCVNSETEVRHCWECLYNVIIISLCLCFLCL